MGISSAFSRWLGGAKSAVSSGVQTAQAQAAALQQRTMTALSGGQQAVTKAPTQRTTSSLLSSSLSPYTTRTRTAVDQLIGATRQMVQARSPAAQGSIGAGPMMPAPSVAVRGALTTTQKSIQQAAQGSIGAGPMMPAPSAGFLGGVAQNVASAASFAARRRDEAQAELARTVGPAAPFEKGWTYPIYKGGQDINRLYQQFILDTEPYRRKTNILQIHPGAYEFGEGFSRSPGLFVEDAAWLLPAAERVGQLVWKEPGKLPGLVSSFVGEQYHSLQDEFRQNPWGAGGELAGTIAIGAAVGGARGRGSRGRGTGPSSSRSASAPATTPRRGGRFGALEFGYQTELVQKTRQVAEKPWTIERILEERQRAGRPRTTESIVRESQASPRQTVASPRADQAATPPTRSPGLRGGRPGLARVPLYVIAAPQDTISLTGLVTTPPTRPQKAATVPQTRSRASSGRGQITRAQTTSASLVAQDTESREDMILAMLYFGPRTSPIQLLSTETIQNSESLLKERRRRRPTSKPPRIAAAPRPTVRRRPGKKDPEEERRRRKKTAEADHWEFGPAPGTEEMAGMVFGSPRTREGSYLDFGPPSVGMRGTSHHEKTAHAGKSGPKKRTPRTRKTRK